MKILSIHDGHNASCCFLENGEIKSLAMEERFTQKKNQSGFPYHSINWILKQYSLAMQDMDQIVFPHLTPPVTFGDNSLHQYTLVRILHMLLCEILPKRTMSSSLLLKPYLGIFKRVRKIQLNKYSNQVNIPWDKVRQVEHHTAHSYSALYGSGFMKNGEPIIIFTIDNSGDGLSSTVSTWRKDKGYQRIHANQTFNSLGELYSRVTEYLGMKMSEHEYKVMGMAPYVDKKYSTDTYKVLKEYMSLDEKGIKFKNHRTYGYGLLLRMRKDLFRHRFDNICAAIQRLLEDLVVPWVSNWCKKTGIRQAVFGGGTFMNVKLNLALTELQELDRLFFFPSSSDESTSIGAAYYVSEKMSEHTYSEFGSPYKGPIFNNDEINSMLSKYTDHIEWQIDDDIEKKLAILIAEGNIIGRFQGRAEWGARALGNRSICCRADDLQMVGRLNKTIKMRDFWMPFAPSILEEDAHRYLINPKHIPASYMMLGFHTKPLAHDHICAALHPYDKSCRPHIVNQTWNPKYHRLLSVFKELTGISGILNTSFNLHGWPIVNSPEDAIRTLLDSNLDYIAIENFLIQKN